MHLFWLKWRHEKESSRYELLWPWWVTGFDNGCKVVSAAIMAADADAGREVVLASYDIRPKDIFFLSVEKRDVAFVEKFVSMRSAPMLVGFTDKHGVRSDMQLDTALYPRQRWMPNFDDPAFDPVSWAEKQACAADNSKRRHRERLARDEADIVALSSDNPKIALFDTMMTTMGDLIADAVTAARSSDIPIDEIVARSLEVLSVRARPTEGYVKLAERYLTELPHGTFVVADDPLPAEIYVKSSSGCVTLDGTRVDSLNPFDTRIFPIRMIGARPITINESDEGLIARKDAL